MAFSSSFGGGQRSRDISLSPVRHTHNHSASNNHQRFVRAALQGSLEFPAYDQDGCIRVQAPAAAEWNLLVSLWAAYNRYLAHVIAHLPASKLDMPCRIGSGDPVTLEFLANDYVRHLVHHLDQIGVRV